MVRRAKTPCRHPGCFALVDEPGYCEKHRRAVRQEVDARRGSSTSRGYGYRWQQYRASFLRRHPLCVHCEREGRVRASREVDHIVPSKPGEPRFWNPTNHQALCKSCHSTKTATENGGFGNALARAPEVGG